MPDSEVPVPITLLMLVHHCMLMSSWLLHSYDVTLPVYNHVENPCGAMHITIGCGGKPGAPAKALTTLR